jgi:hypothetical protein
MMTGPNPNEIETTPPAAATVHLSQGKRTAWPVVTGMIALVSGGLSIPMIFRDVAATLGPAAASQGVASGDMRAINLTIRMGLAIWLVWGSFDLVRRRAVAKKTLQSWATIKVILLSITAVQMIANWFGALPQASTPPGLTSNGFAGAVLVVWLSVIMPVFVLVWFGQGKIKEEVAGWV